jgi:S-adenosylmethionine synthetase
MRHSDQGIKFGHAANETSELSVLPHGLGRRISIIRKDKTMPWFGPDATSR